MSLHEQHTAFCLTRLQQQRAGRGESPATRRRGQLRHEPW